MKKEKNSRKRLNSLILLVAFTAIMLIVSTYAWFTVQNSVKISGITGSVGAVSGLEVSLDGATWTNNLVLTDDLLEENGNVLPTSLTPVSTTATATDRAAEVTGDNAKQAEVKFYKGLYDADTVTLSGITGADGSEYLAFDLYVKNTSSTTADVLKLNKNSTISIDQNKESTGLQNTTRLGLALYSGKVTDVIANKDTVTGAEWGNIADVTIWEPNANAHVAEVLRTNNLVTVDSVTPGTLTGTSQIPTYALSAESVNAGTIANIYTWEGENATDGLTEQVTLQTTTAGVGDTALELPSVDGTNKFTLGDGQTELSANGIYKMRVYLWLEGQDVDTINHASQGGSITLNLGLEK